MIDKDSVIVEERLLLEKFDGEPVPENLTERVHVLNGKITKHEFIEQGNVVKTENFEEV
jgi:hypothetical protein